MYILLTNFDINEEMEEVSLPERCVLLLENVVEGNKRLREVIEERESVQQRLLLQLTSKLDSATKSGRTAIGGRTRAKTSVPQPCRVSFPVLVDFFLA